MDINQLKEQAKNGDIDACIKVGNYCYEQNRSAEGMRESLDWYLIAAEKNDLHAIRMVISTKAIFAHAKIQICAQIGAEYESAISDWDEVGDWADKLLELTEGQKELYDLHQWAFSQWFDAMYHIGVACYFTENYEAIAKMFKNSNETRVQVLKGVTLDIQTEDDICVAYELLKSIETKEYFSLIKFNLEEQIAVFGALRISLYYRWIKKDNEAAVSFLNNSLESFSSSGCRAAIEGEISRYSKKLFGGYSYRE